MATVICHNRSQRICISKYQLRLTGCKLIRKEQLCRFADDTSCINKQCFSASGKCQPTSSGRVNNGSSRLSSPACRPSISPLPLFLFVRHCNPPSFHVLQIKTFIQPSIMRSFTQQQDTEASADLSLNSL